MSKVRAWTHDALYQFYVLSAGRHLRKWYVQSLLKEGSMLEVLSLPVTIVDVDDEAQVVDKLGRCLALIRDADHRRFAQLKRRINTVMISGQPVRLSYVPELRTVTIPYEDFKQDTDLLTASALVHQTCQARFLQRGLPFAPSIRSRIERACVHEQLRFLTRVPNGESVAKDLRDYLSIRQTEG